MATRENQGLQAIIIVLTILTIGLLVGLLLVNNARKTQKARADNEKAQSDKAQSDMGKAQAEAATYKTLMGFPDTENLASVQEAVTADMEKWGLNFPEESRQYRTVLGGIYEENRNLALNAANLAQEVKALKDRMLALEGEKTAEVKKFEDELAKVRADSATAAETAAAERTRILAENDDVKKQMESLRATHDEAVAALEAEKTDLNNQIAKLEQSIDRLREGVPNPDQFAQPADGEVRWVDQRYRTVWVNLGSDDGLRPQVTFAVAEAGLDDAAASEQKGSIEITKIEGPHLAEARITSDDATNPILPGDRVFSQVWDRGRKVGIGISGIIDIDGDGKSDLETLKSIITANGGSVDAAPDATGKQEGSLKVSTRYLVLGEFPSGGQPKDLALRTTWEDLSTEATALGVETVPVDEFLSLLGWQSEARSVAMGADSRAEDFPPTPPGESLPRRPVQPSGVFKKRLPNSTF